ncbi:MAG: hypothetical protein IJA22_01035, partial [Clostridia bacterium]|nr:hypothetical protein [Clostridia bacterium]
SYSSGTPTAGEINVTAVAGSITLQFEEVAKPSFTVTYNLTDCTSNKTSGASVTYGTSYSATITPTTGYSLPSTITVANISTGGYSWDYLTGVFTITDWTKVNGNITITAAAMPFAIKTYNTTNVTTNYNSAWDGYSYVEFGEYPATHLILSSPTATGETYTYGDNTFAIYQDANGRYVLDGIYSDGTYYYKFEPIRWIIIATSGELTDTTIYGNGANKHADMPAANENKKQLLLLSEFGLYGDWFNYSSANGNKFFGSTIQTSLNGGFAEMAGLKQYFASEVGKNETGKYIAKVQPGTTYNNGSAEAFDSTSSYNMFLLGMTNGNDSNVDTYHWDEYMDEGSEQMQCVSLFDKYHIHEYDDIYNAAPWWLRSGLAAYNVAACNVYYNGNALGYGVADYFAVRPSFILNLA